MGSINGAYIEITGACNASCPYCYNSKLVNSGKSLPTNKIIDILVELKEMGIPAITLSGGEPFLHSGLEDILKEAKLLDIGINIISNGTCFENKNINLLLEYQPGLQITFDGFDEISHDATRGANNFKLITDGIKMVKTLGHHASIVARINLHRKNISHIKEFLTMFIEKFDVDSEHSREIESISIALLRRTENEEFQDFLKVDEYKEYIEIIGMFKEWNRLHSAKIDYDLDNTDIGCPFNSPAEEVECGVRIALDGNVFPCQLFTDDQFSIGNIYTSTLNGIMHGDTFAAFINMVHMRKYHIEECKSCGYKLMCGCGCPAQAFIVNKKLDSVTPQCISRKNHFKIMLSQTLKDMRLTANACDK